MLIFGAKIQMYWLRIYWSFRSQHCKIRLFLVFFWKIDKETKIFYYLFLYIYIEIHLDVGSDFKCHVKSSTNVALLTTTSSFSFLRVAFLAKVSQIFRGHAVNFKKKRKILQRIQHITPKAHASFKSRIALWVTIATRKKKKREEERAESIWQLMNKTESCIH